GADDDASKRRRGRRRKKRKDLLDDLREVELGGELTVQGELALAPEVEQAQVEQVQVERALPPGTGAVVHRLEMKLAQVFDEHLGRTEDAIVLLQGVVARDPSDGEALALLERVLRR